MCFIYTVVEGTQWIFFLHLCIVRILEVQPMCWMQLLLIFVVVLVHTHENKHRPPRRMSDVQKSSQINKIHNKIVFLISKNFNAKKVAYSILKSVKFNNIVQSTEIYSADIISSSKTGEKSEHWLKDWFNISVKCTLLASSKARLIRLSHLTGVLFLLFWILASKQVFPLRLICEASQRGLRKSRIRIRQRFVFPPTSIFHVALPVGAALKKTALASWLPLMKTPITILIWPWNPDFWHWGSRHLLWNHKLKQKKLSIAAWTRRIFFIYRISSNAQHSETGSLHLTHPGGGFHAHCVIVCIYREVT